KGGSGGRLMSRCLLFELCKRDCENFLVTTLFNVTSPFDRHGLSTIVRRNGAPDVIIGDDVARAIPDKADFKAARSWFVFIQQYVPISFDHTQLRSWYFRAPFPPVDNGWLHRVLRRAAAPWLPFVVPYYIRKITAEDNKVCEQLQQIASQVHGFPILSRYEEPIAWFEEAYAAAIADQMFDHPEPGVQQEKS